MTSFQRCGRNAALIGACLMVTHEACAQNVDGYHANLRVFNDNPGSTLTITPAGPINGNPANFTINDQYTGAFTGANRNDILASTDGGATAHVFGIDDSFVFMTQLILTDGFNSPRKEAGIRINSSPASGVGDMLFLVNSDAGEIVAFGGPFYSFGSNGGGNGYTPGASILLGIREIGGGDGIGGIQNTIEFFINRGSGIETSGPLPWTNLEGGPVDFTVGVYAQGGANASGDFVNAAFTSTSFSVVPEPTAAALLGLGFLGLLARRRKD